MGLPILSFKTKMSSVNSKNKDWDDVLARFDIQDQDDSDLLDHQGETSTNNNKSASVTSRWAIRAMFLVGCTTVLGNLPLQSFLSNDFSNPLEITLNEPAAEAPKAKPAEPKPPAPEVEASADITDNLLPVSNDESTIATSANVTPEININQGPQELILPKQALGTFAGYELINTKSTWQTYTVKGSDSQSTVFRQIKQPKVLQNLKQIEPIAKALKDMKTGTIVRAQSYKGKLEQLVFTSDYKNSYVIKPTESGSFVGKWQKKQFEVRQARATFSVKKSLFADAEKAEVPKNIARQIVKVFDWDVDFSANANIDDQITVVFENIYHNGDRVGSLNLLAAEFIDKDEVYRSIRHTTARGLTDYFTPEGREMKRAFMRKPLAHAKVSSHFNPHRLHPVLKKLRAHKGTDFAAPSGTPIFATGDGEVEMAGTKGGYGNTIILKHREGYTTLYSHLSKFKKGLKKGQVVAQGDIIGYVGSSGLATGPNLHYEFRKNNVPVNPITVKLPNSLSLTKKELASFKVDAINMKLQLKVLHRFAKENVDINSATGG